MLKPIMKGMKLVIWVCLYFGLVSGEISSNGDHGKKQKYCGFPAIFNFGDSNSDTGGRSAAFKEVPPPNGVTFFTRPSGRVCDGRLIIDLIADRLELQYLSAYLDSIGADFRNGANFATVGSSILPGGYSPFYLGVQISQFLQFKKRTILHNDARMSKDNDGDSHERKIDKDKFSNSKWSSKVNLPKSEDFSKALYTFDIGQNDLSYGFQHSRQAEVRASIPLILDNFTQAIHQLYSEGALNFWIHNTGPIGCLPYSVINYPLKPKNLDAIGCVESQNEVAVEFNKQLKDRISQLKKELLLATFTYVDVYSAKYKLISTAKNQGFVDPQKFCCGWYYNGTQVACGQVAIVNGTEYGNACSDPTKYISWDGIHYTDAANVWLANSILNGTFSDPPVSIEQSCNPLSTRV